MMLGERARYTRVWTWASRGKVHTRVWVWPYWGKTLPCYLYNIHTYDIGGFWSYHLQRVAWTPKWDLRVGPMHWIGLEQILDHKDFRGNSDVFIINKNIACLKLPENVQGKEWSPSQDHINSGLMPGSLPFQHKLYVWKEYYLYVDNFHWKLFIVLEFLLLSGEKLWSDSGVRHYLLLCVLMVSLFFLSSSVWHSVCRRTYAKCFDQKDSIKLRYTKRYSPNSNSIPCGLISIFKVKLCEFLLL